MKREKILIIDDEKDFCQLLKNYLERKNYQVEVYNLLNDGLHAIEKHSAGIVFLDNNLPDGLGWEKIADLRERYPELKIHLLSGYHYTSSAINRGDQIQVWQKPISFNDLDRYFNNR